MNDALAAHESAWGITEAELAGKTVLDPRGRSTPRHRANVYFKEVAKSLLGGGDVEREQGRGLERGGQGEGGDKGRWKSGAEGVRRERGSTRGREKRPEREGAGAIQGARGRGILGEA